MEKYVTSSIKNCKINIMRIHPDATIPSYLYEGDSGSDISSISDYILKPLKPTLISTGLCFDIPKGYEIQIRPKSGLALEHGITVLNSPGTIDSGYRGELFVLLINFGQKDYQVKKGQKIAQLVCASVIRVDYIEANHLSESERQEAGFGHKK